MFDGVNRHFHCPQMTETLEENAMLRGKILTLNETLNNSELETKASRETIMRLVSEMGREQSLQSRYESERETLRSVCWLLIDKCL